MRGLFVLEFSLCENAGIVLLKSVEQNGKSGPDILQPTLAGYSSGNARCYAGDKPIPVFGNPMDILTGLAREDVSIDIQKLRYLLKPLVSRTSDYFDNSILVHH